MHDCIFCKILKGEIPCDKIYENKQVCAFLDILPVNPGHTLVIPKKHYENIEELPEDVLCEMSKVVKKIGQAMIKGLDVKGYNLALNNRTMAGQVVPHVHFHVIPRVKGDGLRLWPQRKYQEQEAQTVAEKLIKNL